MSLTKKIELVKKIGSCNIFINLRKEFFVDENNLIQGKMYYFNEDNDYKGYVTYRNGLKHGISWSHKLTDYYFDGKRCKSDSEFKDKTIQERFNQNKTN